MVFSSFYDFWCDQTFNDVDATISAFRLEIIINEYKMI